jgi:tRNA/tmRNA/rRNA uracil-C5-methylase (TrmA/RlmC/RlmD family)
VRHCEIYTFIQENVAKPYARKLARHLNYVVIKGNYDEQTIIFNINDLSPDVVRVANTLSKSLTRSFSTIIGVFLYEDVSRSRYYLRSHGRRGRLPFRKVFGKAEVFHRVAGRSFLFSPLSFSQINHSILEQTIHTARTLLMPSKEQRFFDLYCGYGLFALCCAAECKAVVGAEASAASIASAVANARRQKAANVRFMLTDINKETIERILHTAQFDDLVLLDPPRSGTADGVIEQIAATRPARVLHIFCEIELIPKELKRWEQSGYRPTRAVPLDMFPGTSDVEIMVALKPLADTPRIR